MKWNIAIGACCIVLLVFNVALVRQNRQLKAQLSLPPPAMEVPAGTKLPDLKGFDLGGKPVELAYGSDARKALILVFSPTCGFCAQNWPKWYELMSTLDRGAVRPVAVDVSSSSTASFLAEHHFSDIPVMLQVDPTDRLSYRFQITPQTILINGNGKVEKVWSGVLDNTAVEELKQRMGIPKAADSAHTGF